MPFINGIGPGELIIILIIALIVVGPGKLPDVGSALGKSIREFRKAATDVKEATSLDPMPAPAPAPVQAPAAAPVPAPIQAAPIAPVVAAVVVAEAAPAPASAPVAAVPDAPVDATAAESDATWPAELVPAEPVTAEPDAVAEQQATPTV